MSEKFVFDKTSPDADKYTELDKFLQLTERFSKMNLGPMKLANKVGSKFGLFKHSKPYSALQRTLKIVEADGIEEVYDDLMHSERIQRSDIFIGKKYLFRQGNYMIRMKDVERCYVMDEKTGDDRLYYCYVDVSDETGSEKLEIRKLSALTVQRQQQFDMINVPIEKAKQAQ